jgi:hypothetical protein
MTSDMVYKKSFSPDNISGEEGFKDIVKSMIEENRITLNQGKGLYLEIPVYIALQNLGIHPIPLHNPFTSAYVFDTHLSVDQLFYYNGLLYSNECKNISPSTDIGIKWTGREVISRFDGLEEVGIKTDVKLLTLATCKEKIKPYLDDSYEVVEIGYQVYPEDWSGVISVLEKLYSDLFRRIEPEYCIDPLHGSKVDYMKLKRIQQKLKECFNDVKELEGLPDE